MTFLLTLETAAATLFGIRAGRDPLVQHDLQEFRAGRAEGGY